MVTVLLSAAVLAPAPGGTSAAQAHFEPQAGFEPMSAADIVRTFSRKNGSGSAVAYDDMGGFETASGPIDGADGGWDSRLAYDLQAVLNGASSVPRVTLASLPGDLHKIRETAKRKAVFFKTVLPLVLQVNEQIAQDRQRLRDLAARKSAGQTLAAHDRLWLAVMAERYRTKRGDIPALLKRHDIVPPSLALAQAAIESAWGTSRFVREGNAMFGQWTYEDDHDGIVPSERADGMTHRIRAFGSLYESVLGYVTNLNRHRAYQEFRQLRADMRADGLSLDGRKLANTLHRYSERGAAYVSELHAIMDGNELGLLDSARLSADGAYEPMI